MEKVNDAPLSFFRERDSDFEIYILLSLLFPREARLETFLPAVTFFLFG